MGAVPPLGATEPFHIIGVRQTPDLADLRCRDPHARAEKSVLCTHSYSLNRKSRT